MDPLLREILVAVSGVSITMGCSSSSPLFILELIETNLVLIEGVIPLDGGELVVSTQNLDATKK